jgi:hypothetical protein
MGIGESVSKGFAVTKKSMSLILLLFVFGFIFNLLNLFLVPPAPAPVAGAAAQAPSPALIAIAATFILLTIYFQAGSMAFIRDLLKTGSANLGNFKAGGGKYYLRLFVLGLAVSLIVGVFVLLAALSVALLQKLPFVSVPLAILFAALGIYFVLLLFLAPYVAVVDDKGARASIKLSMKLVKKNILTLLGISVIMILIGFGLGLILGAILAGVSIVIKVVVVSHVIFAFLSSLVNAFLGVFVTGAIMTFYLSLTDRNI